jgi:alginate biosynthesis protein AlgX
MSCVCVSPTLANTIDLGGPEYLLQKCCVPCAATFERSAYNTSYLENFIFLNKGQEDWLFRTETELLREFGTGPEDLRQLSIFTQKLLQRGTQLVIIYVPTKGLVHPAKLPENHWFDFAGAAESYRLALARLRSTGAIVPDLAVLLNEETEQEFYFRRDHHWSPHGAQRTAEVVADAIRQLPYYNDFDKTEFATRRDGLIAKNGTLQIAWRRLCGNGFADQYVEAYTTELASEGELLEEDDVSRFLDDDSLPPITLVGTSFSKGAVDYNFAGFLKEYLSVDILNEAMAGGNSDGSLMQYLISDAFQEQPPKLLLWELPAYSNLGSDQLYRQINAMVDDGCNNKPTVLQEQTELKQGQTEILFNGGGKVQQLAGRNYVVDLQFSDPTVTEADFNVWYLNGRKSRTNIEYSTRLKMNGRFITRLRQDEPFGDFNFLSIDLSVENPAPVGTVTATLCQYDPLVAQQ